jgi:hypothetical protein
VVGLAILWVSLAILFNGAPEIDKAVSSYFFILTECANALTTPVCGDFPASSVPFLKTLRRVFYALPMVGASVVVTIALRDLASGLRWNHERIRISTIALITLAVGPGLLVNGYMKEFIGKAPSGRHIFVRRRSSLHCRSRVVAGLSAQLLIHFRRSVRHRLDCLPPAILAAQGKAEIVLGNYRNHRPD